MSPSHVTLARARAMTSIKSARELQQMGRAKGPARLAVEAQLRPATRTNPIGIGQIAAQCGHSLTLVRCHVHNSVANGLAHNVTPGRVPAVYAWGPGPEAAKPEAAVPSRAALAAPRAPIAAADPDHYLAPELRPYQGRPGAMDAFTLPSLVDGTAVERRRPMLIGGAARELR